MQEAIPPFPNTYLWCGTQLIKKHRDNFTCTFTKCYQGSDQINEIGGTIARMREINAQLENLTGRDRFRDPGVDERV
jgi:hypothetical protein